MRVDGYENLSQAVGETAKWREICCEAGVLIA
jgi:hypothetical protein